MKLMIATESFSCDVNGQPINVVAGQTRVEERHELVKRFPEHFQPVDAAPKIETATAAPARK